MDVLWKITYRLLYLLAYALILIGGVVRRIIDLVFRPIRYIGMLLLQLFYFKKKKKPKIERTRLVLSFQSLRWFVLGVIFTMLFVGVPFIVVSWLRQLPDPHTLSQMKLPATTKFYDSNGKLLYELYADIDRRPVALDKIPQDIVNATIAVEDQEFYHHLGFSLRGMFRAAREIILNKKLQGGSTITQQLIKNTLLTPETTISRKLKEVVIASWAEIIYSKDEILSMYLNNVPYGGTAWGIRAASEKYFGTDVTELTLAQSALLAGLPAAPTTYSPFGANPELAKKRQELVLSQMFQMGYITEQERERAKQEQLNFTQPGNTISAPHFVMYTKQVLDDLLGPRIVEQGGLQITTTLDLDLQNVAQEIVQEELAKLARLNVGNAAVLVTKPETGEIVAMVGSRDYYDELNDGNVNITTSLQQPGSSIKPINYVAALQNGMTAATLINDSPISYVQPNGKVYSPVNYDGRFHGIVPLRWALANSYNIPAVKVLDKIGVSSMVEQGQAMGIDSWEDSSRFGLSLTLGGGEVTMLDMAEAYGVFANGGKLMELLPVLEIEDFQGKSLDDFAIDRKQEQVIPEGAAFIISDILADNASRSRAFGVNSLLHIPGKYVSVKTGTSNEKRDNWTVGYTKDFVVVVWVGNNDNSPMHPTLTSGITGATPIWRRVMDYLLEDREALPPAQPDDVVRIPCYGRYEYFIKGTAPVRGCGIWPKFSPSSSPTPTQ
ncbi:penicillin-binding protein [Candidatus Roizmanbacteria bacterium CG22_combo_CG10-13_8_21_14_all_38_20]|uniref:Penicillin-binding protein n=1 Tax=Candidatus Roizmanbacteria bacterium CG22_combo_CG10-13_8_21_14_all_38_20 TaxID=1974862 RepID=A0A2H0BWM8_9BACT|nr:penicillin-binding protein [Candidatus Microgenomates bacterium]PIP62086.1 MAG: penicillin-binding protein [Candidatus Roizmanbacteria bacterium CG22_combo_CG10-13_8_21_14_all_38_20]PJC31811.1 MAG: penicillin-binding protein [Candidatus Roizmanbacteria bacterium CG_4_9_14_0_2_um_filter_38_17]